MKSFSPSDKIYSTNGDCVLHPFKAKVHKEDNGDYYLDFEAGIQYTNYLVSGKIT